MRLQLQSQPQSQPEPRFKVSIYVGPDGELSELHFSYEGEVVQGIGLDGIPHGWMRRQLKKFVDADGTITLTNSDRLFASITERTRSSGQRIS